MEYPGVQDHGAQRPSLQGRSAHHASATRPLFHAPKRVLDHLTGWHAPLHVDPNSSAATWLAGCDLHPHNGGYHLVGGALPPRTQGPALCVEGASLHDVGDGVLLSVPHPTRRAQALWWPVVLEPAPDPVVVDGYTLSWTSRRLWEGDEGLAITDGEGGDVPPAIFTRRLGPEALRRAFTLRAQRLEHGLTRFAADVPPLPTVTTDFEQRPSPHVWEPWRPRKRLFGPQADLTDNLGRLARLLSPIVAREGGMIALRGGHPQQNGRLSPLELTVGYPVGHDLAPPVPRAHLRAALDLARAQGWLGTLDGEPWVSSAVKPLGIAIPLPPGPSSAHHTLAEQAWARDLGWSPEAAL